MAATSSTKTTYPASAPERDRWILARRPARNAVEVRRPQAFLIEQEPAADGEIAEVTTIFLTGRECPWRCLMCDLWKHTTEERTPVGAIPAQIDFALAELGGSRSREAAGAMNSPQKKTAGVRGKGANEHPESFAPSSSPAQPPRHLKLYNSGSFFDRAAVPVEDYEPIARRAVGFERVIVESHPALIGDLTLRFRDLLTKIATTDIGHLLSPSLLSNRRFEGAFSLSPREARAGREPERGASQKRIPPLPNPLLPPASGREGEVAEGLPGYREQGAHNVREYLSCIQNEGGGVRRTGEEAHTTAINTAPQLEVAMGLETAHPGVLEKLNKRVTLEQFAEAANFLKREGIALRVFVLVKPPFMDESGALDWAVRSTQVAFDCGAEVVSLIPTRFGNGALEALAAQGQFAPPRLATLETALEQGIALERGRVFADVWDLEKFSACPACFGARRERMERMNLEQQLLPPIRCEHCT